MSIATWLRRVTAVVVLLALGAPAWTVCRTVTAAESMAQMPCCHEAHGTASGALGGDCCRVQPEDPAGSPITPATAPAARAASIVATAVALPVATVNSHVSHDRRAEADGRHRPKTVPHLLDSVLLI